VPHGLCEARRRDRRYDPGILPALPVLIARLTDRATAIGYAKAALKRSVAIVPLDAPPERGGDHLLLVHAPGLDEPIMVAAVPVGEPTGGMYPLRLGPRDDFGEGALLALLAQHGALSVPPPAGPRAPSARPPSLLELARDVQSGRGAREGRLTADAPPAAPPTRSRPPPRIGTHSPPPPGRRSRPPIPRGEPDLLDEDRRAMAAMAAELRALAQRGDVVALRALLSRLEGEARGAMAGDGSREALAARALTAVDDAAALSQVAEIALSGVPAAREAAGSVLRSVPASGASALCTARARLRTREARPRFLAAMRDLGDAATASIVVALEGAVDANGADAQTVEDLLRAATQAGARDAGALASRFLSHAEPAVRTAALVTLAAIDGPRSRDALAGALADVHDQVRITALATLRRIGGIDDEVVAAIGRILAGDAAAGDELRATAAAALADATSREAAVAILTGAIEAPKAGVIAAMLSRVVKSDDDAHVLETMARVLLALGGDAGRRAIERRAEESHGKVRARLMAVLAGREPA
jgi:hypothetical protein